MDVETSIPRPTSITISTRRNNGKPNPTVEIKREDIKQLQQLKQEDAAIKLGISLTALKKACRRLGFEKWPYCRIRSWNKFDCTDLITIASDKDLFEMHQRKALELTIKENTPIFQEAQVSQLRWRVNSDEDLLDEALKHVEYTS
eukprot:766586-Hanusia_phi.AAC.7